MDTNASKFSRWNFPDVQWKYSPKLSSGEPLDVLVAEWASRIIIEPRDVQTAVMKLVFAWLEAHRTDGPQDEAPGGFKGLRVITALAACQLAKREFVSMETAKLMNPNHHKHMSECISEIEQVLWDKVRRENPGSGYANRTSNEVKIACVAAFIVEAIQAMCDIIALIELHPVDTPAKIEMEEEVIMASAFWTMSSPADRIITLSMVGLGTALLDKTEVWEEAKDIGYFPLGTEDPTFVDAYIDLVRRLLRLTRKEFQKEAAEIITE